MDKEAVIKELQYLGLDKHEYRVLLLTPLVQVAWADDVIIDGERSVIKATVAHLEINSADAERRVNSWLQHQPTEDYLLRARKLIRELAPHSVGIGKDIDGRTLLYVIDQCKAVARAGSGLMGFLRYDPRSASALEDIRADLDPESINYDAVVEWEADPEPVEEEEEEEDWDDEDEEWDDEEWEEDEEEDVGDGPSVGLKLGTRSAKVSQKKLDAVQQAQKSAQVTRRKDGRKKRVAPSLGNAKSGGVAGVDLGPPGFDDDLGGL